MTATPHAQSLVRMANQIAQFFESQSGPKAAADTAEHLRRFWDPRMREAIVSYARGGGAGLRESAAAAVSLLGSAAS